MYEIKYAQIWLYMSPCNTVTAVVAKLVIAEKTFSTHVNLKKPSNCTYLLR